MQSSNQWYTGSLTFCVLYGNPRELDTFIQILNYAKLKPMEYRFFDLVCFSRDPWVLDTFIQILNYAKFKPMEHRFFDLLCWAHTVLCNTDIFDLLCCATLIYLCCFVVQHWYICVAVLCNTVVFVFVFVTF